MRYLGESDKCRDDRCSGFSGVFFGTIPEGKRLPSISLNSIAAIVISIGESHTWNARGPAPAQTSRVLFVAPDDMHSVTRELGGQSHVLTINHAIHGKG